MTIASFSTDKHPSLDYSQDIIDICKPLKTLDITYFSHAKIDKDANFSGMSNNPYFSDFYFRNKFYNADIHMAKGQFENFVLWDLLDLRGDSAKMDEGASSYGVRHVFTIIEKDSDCDNYYHFGTHVANKSFNQIYLANLELLNLFVGHFKENVGQSRILTSIYDFKFKMDKKGKYQLGKNSGLLTPADKSEFIRDLAITPTLIKSSSDLAISKREAEVLSLMVNGLGAKQIAHKLFISKRTVEHHIENMKSKLGITSKTTLIKMALKANDAKFIK